MFKRILIPLDGSEQSEKALVFGEEISCKLGSEIVLLHVCGPGQEQYKHMYKIYLDNMAQNMERNIKEMLQDKKPVKITTEVEAGESRETVCNLVQKRDIDLVIMTSVSTAGIKISKMLGSVADHVCRTVPIPVMLIKPQSGARKSKKGLITRIFLPLDGSELSKRALPVSEEFASKLEIPITLFQMATMTQPSGYVTEDPSYIDYTLLNEELEKRDLSEIVSMEKQLKNKGFAVTHVVKSGTDAASEIIETSKKVGADLVVMSTHGRSGISSWAFGSVAEKLLRYGEIPLLLVNARAE